MLGSLLTDDATNLGSRAVVQEYIMCVSYTSVVLYLTIVFLFLRSLEQIVSRIAVLAKTHKIMDKNFGSTSRDGKHIQVAVNEINEAFNTFAVSVSNSTFVIY
jgi:hypothetical protein